MTFSLVKGRVPKIFYFNIYDPYTCFPTNFKFQSYYKKNSQNRVIHSYKENISTYRDRVDTLTVFMALLNGRSENANSFFLRTVVSLLLLVLSLMKLISFQSGENKTRLNEYFKKLCLLFKLIFYLRGPSRVEDEDSSNSASVSSHRWVKQTSL